MEGFEYRRLYHVWIFTSHESQLQHPFFTTLDLQLPSIYRPLCYNSRAHCPLLQCLRTTSAILADAHSCFEVSSFKCEGKIVTMTSCWNIVFARNKCAFYKNVRLTRLPNWRVHVRIVTTNLGPSPVSLVKGININLCKEKGIHIACYEMLESSVPQSGCLPVCLVSETSQVTWLNIGQVSTSYLTYVISYPRAMQL